jgi:hypothetical protein
MQAQNHIRRLLLSVPDIEPRYYEMITFLLISGDAIAAVDRYPELVTDEVINQVNKCVFPLLQAREMELAGKAAALVKILRDIATWHSPRPPPA